MTDPIRLRLERWKQQLIDLTLRNRLLNFKPTPVTTIRVVDELPAEVFRTLQIANRSMSFQPASAASVVSVKPVEGLAVISDQEEEATDSGNEFSHVDREQLASHHIDTKLQTSLAPERLAMNLLRIYQQSASLFEEQGASALFLALGMIEWYEDENSDARLKAPLILLPVELNRQNARSKFTLRAAQEDPVVNPAFTEKLKRSFGLKLPPLPEISEDFALEDYFAQVQRLISNEARWRVTNEIYLGLFSFQKFVMYRDLEINEQVFAEHPVITALCLGKGDRLGPLPDELLNAKLDQVLSPETTDHVLDADSSQQRALLAVRSGRDLVLEGPPGTGKSQTIANLIADALASGKRVLFVSEKMAALDVVHNRLATLGLNDFCLELHSNKTNKKIVHEELARVLNKGGAQPPTTDGTMNRLSAVREDLTGYVNDLHEPFGKLNEKPFTIFGAFDQVKGAPVINATVTNLPNYTSENFDQLCRDFDEHASLLNEVGDPTRHPWRGCVLQNITGAQSGELQELIDVALIRLAKLVENAAEFAEEIGAATARTFGQVEMLCEIALSLAASPGASESLLRNSGWNSLSAEASEILRRGSEYVSQRDETIVRYKPELLEVDFASLLNRYAEACRNWTRVFSLAFWRDRKALRSYFQSTYRPASNEQLIADLQIALACRYNLLFLRASEVTGQSLFGQHWRGAESDWCALQRFAEWIVSVRRFVIEEALQAKGIEMAAAGRLDVAYAQARVGELRESLRLARETIEQAARLAALAPASGVVVAAENDMETVIHRLEGLSDNFAGLHLWTQYQRSLRHCLDGIGGAALRRCYEMRIAPEQFVPALKRLFYRNWLDLVSAARPRLANFRAMTHEQRIAEFKQLDQHALEIARQRIRHRLLQQRGKLVTDRHLERELVIVQTELKKKSRHRTLRQLLNLASNAVLTIKPCLMMSPLSVAQYLDPQRHKFDLVVFDEASQITSEDAIGAIVRGKQVVVVGDDKQLPPTNFFASQIAAVDGVDADEDEEQGNVLLDSPESVLGDFVRVGFARWRLKWHYRSRHESLITFSNRNFYEDELLTFPGPETDTHHFGVRFEWAGGVYEGKGMNPIEARVVADAVCEHIRTVPHLSLGVGTFNIRQQTLILDELEKRRREDPLLESFFANKGENHFFVKNLENIQGDDRDVIFISVTYGPDATGRVRHNFGPINGPNGWRRLNVILTRAKQSLRLFTSMRGDQIDPTRSTSEGARLLREYLLFAERGVLEQAKVDPAAILESPFELSVYQELTRRGLRLVPQVGQSGYRIDFGVLDHETPGRFVAGIECDGATYHSAATSRDRDRLRQEILERLGWRIHRIWSTDWYHDRNAQIARILSLIEQSREAAKRVPSNGVKSPLSTTSAPSVEKTNAVPTQTKVTLSAPAKLPLPPLYQLTSVQPLGSPDQFHGAADSAILQTLLRIVQLESPIHLAEAVRRVAAHWQIARAGNRIRERIEQVVRSQAAQQKLFAVGEFLWWREQKTVPVRSRAIPGYEFSAEEICPEEYEAAVMRALHSLKMAMNETLITETARLLGYERAGRKLAELITAAIVRLVQKGLMQVVSGGLYLVQRESVV
ncbi:MAG: DUF3320 domain-containing protein [Acidobacteria bacterium]|nr:DUF3320 domain-containing protein [Acidobacteriota bacterium]